ncbi:NAD(P)-dependent oxidoreductase [Nocardia brasiliensis]|uniref:NAD-dependent glycerol-3-phosphate dehydrogenase domain-containing protein n=1 Tax=Nocardia brasiliensis (strain ATCC 700358 / HUJEG-1) TaxID=1133849 RepID=K0F5J1_NOCB7|nr:SDR family oxidoreductase [Nocardia brasiliensis]AFU04859.1 NAD-dependent glycerol-3-phosphate dehydrogenase domain-containing protein [Nocardia brasiliensis ATCC 700358]OCF88186.1 glycerol-3-phosphate dehydrogenase [Nocardia brasiliensis]
MSNVVVFGAAGRAGQHIVTEALSAGHTVTAAVRSPATLSGPFRVVRADVRDPDSVRAAVAGHDVVVSAIGPSGWHADGLYSAGARALVSAMRETDVHRLIAITSSGVRRDDPNHPLWYRLVAKTLMRELYGDMRLMETIIRDSGLDWTFVRPARLTDDPPTGTCRVQDGENPSGGWQLSLTDLARFIAAELDAPQWIRRTPTLAQ